jgi:hypothetical protein
MKTFLYDFTNYGVIYVADDFSRWHLGILRACILDTNIGTVAASNQHYKQFNNQLIQDQFFQIDRSDGVALGNTVDINDYFVEKCRLAQLMAPVVSRLCRAINLRTLKNIDEFGTVIDSALYASIAGVDPLEENWSPGILEYASTLDITPRAAYQELKLEYESLQAYKIRAYATSKKYQIKIRSITTQQDADLLIAEIDQRLINDTYI